MQSKEWIEKHCLVEAGKREALTSRHPYLHTIASVVSASTNSLYGQMVRTCSFVRSFQLNSTIYQQEVECSYDDIDLAFIIKVTDGLEFLQTLHGYPAGSPVALSPPPLSSVTVPPAPAMELLGPTLVFTAKLGAQAIADFESDVLIQDLHNFAPGELLCVCQHAVCSLQSCSFFCKIVVAVDIQARILSARQLKITAPKGIIVETAIKFRHASEISQARSLLTSLLSDPSSVFRTDLLPVDILEARIAATGLNGCSLAAENCGAHGILYPLTPFGCTCECDPGWQNGHHANATNTYCSG